MDTSKYISINQFLLSLNQCLKMQKPLPPKRLSLFALPILGTAVVAYRHTREEKRSCCRPVCPGCLEDVDHPHKRPDKHGSPTKPTGRRNWPFGPDLPQSHKRDGATIDDKEAECPIRETPELPEAVTNHERDGLVCPSVEHPAEERGDFPRAGEIPVEQIAHDGVAPHERQLESIPAFGEKHCLKRHQHQPPKRQEVGHVAFPR